MDADGGELTQAWCKTLETQPVYTNGILGQTPPLISHANGKKKTECLIERTLMRRDPVSMCRSKTVIRAAATFLILPAHPLPTKVHVALVSILESGRSMWEFPDKSQKVTG